MKAFLTDIERNINEIRWAIEEALLAFRAKPDDSDAARQANEITAFLAEVGIYGLIKRVSSSVGLEDLRDTYEAVRNKEGEAHVPTRLIDLAIRLDHFPRIPIPDIEDLAKRLSAKVVAYTILKLLVADRLYLFPADYRERQKLTDLLGFDRKRQLLTEKKVRALPSGSA
jgi:hypothetical protein